MKDTWSTKLAQKLLQYIIAVFVSPEFICVVIFCIIYFTRSIPFDKIAFFFFKNEDNDIIKWITIPLPIAFFIAAISMHKLLIQPEENNKILFHWHRYKDFKLASYIGLAFCFLPIIPSFFSWVQFNTYSEYDVGFFYVLLNTISVISLTTMFFAQYNVKYYLQKYM
jgi:hypothetical protein